MADRRMFALDVIDCDKFLDMTHDTQLLYFHLSMMADDDGIVSKPRGILRQCGISADGLNELISNGYVIPFISGAVAITHWKLSNQIRGDRYHPTIYKDEFSELVADETGVYTRVVSEKEAQTENAVPTVKTERENAVPTVETEKENAVPTVQSQQKNAATEVSIGKVSSGKVSIDMEREDEDTSRTKKSEEEFNDWLYEELPFCEPSPAEENNTPDKIKADNEVNNRTSAQNKYGEYNNVVLTYDELDSLKKEFPRDWQKKIDRLSAYMASSGKKYRSHFATIRSWAMQDARSKPKKEDLYAPEDSVDDLFGIGG